MILAKLKDMYEVIAFRLQIIYYAISGELLVPTKEFTSVGISEDTMLLTKKDNMLSLEVAMWVLSKNDHYWQGTTMGKDVLSQVTKDENWGEKRCVEKH